MEEVAGGHVGDGEGVFCGSRRAELGEDPGGGRIGDGSEVHSTSLPGPGRLTKSFLDWHQLYRWYRSEKPHSDGRVRGNISPNSDESSSHLLLHMWPGCRNAVEDWSVK